MQNESNSNGKQFAPHPGHIIHHLEWDNSDKTVDAKDVPDGVKFVYYDAQGRETSDGGNAVRRVPVVRSVILTVDSQGKPVSPDKAANVSITDYGPNGQFLRHTSATANQ